MPNTADQDAAIYAFPELEGEHDDAQRTLLAFVGSLVLSDSNRNRVVESLLYLADEAKRMANVLKEEEK